jgi:predicted KAP-like P-loop ATPase
MGNSWIDYCEPPRPRPAGIDWDVFISYRSLDRVWSIALYDMLVQCGYTVFLDQFVLVPGQGLTTQLGRNLQRSASAVLIWSERAEDSKWVEKELDLMSTMQVNSIASDFPFNFMVASLDGTIPLGLMAGQLYVDFSQYPDGPTGGDLVRLTCGLQGKPLSPEAVRQLVAFDSTLKEEPSRLLAMAKSGLYAKILERMKSDDPAYTTSAQLSGMAIDLLIRGKRYKEAIEACEFAIAHFPGSIRLQQLLGLALNAITIRDSIGQELENDLAQGEDRLNVKLEINALTNLLMLRDLKPPLAVGILGGWGSGKSFCLYLMKQRINEIRSKALTEAQAWGNTDQLSPYVGHIYQIEFDAWTYAKSNLWASLMQKIFLELNRQISLEQKLEAANVDLLKGGQIWKALNNMSDENRRQILESNLTPDVFKSWEDIDNSQKISSVLWERLERLQQDDIKKLRDEQESLFEKQNELNKIQIAIEVKVDQRIRQDSRALLWKPLSEDLSKIMGKTFKIFQSRLIDKDDADKVKILLEELEPDFWHNLLKTSRNNLRITLLFIASLILLIASPWLLTQLNSFLITSVLPETISSIIRRMLAFLIKSPAIVLGISFLQTIWNGWKRYRKQVKQVLESYKKNVVAQQEELIKSRQAFIEIEKSKDTELVLLEEKVRRQQLHVQQVQHRISIATTYSSLNDLIDARFRTDPYSEQLGLIQQVKGDIEQLTDRLVIQNDDPDHVKEKKLELFHRGPARVVLYIDDLDRCPPNKVVEVLEAVQLLVKTSLFIVVLSIDDRYIARALEEVYKGVLKRRGKPSGIDYLEKIVQITYRMRSISPSNVKNYLDFQMKIEDDDQVLGGATSSQFSEDSNKDHDIEELRTTTVAPPLGTTQKPTNPGLSNPIEIPKTNDTITEVIKFSRSESELLESSCKHVDLSPRTAKRLINTYKIIKIIWSQYPSLGLSEPEVQIKQVTITLLVLSGRYPDYIGYLFEELGTQFEELGHSDNDNPTLTLKLTELLSILQQQVSTHDHHNKREWRRFTHDVIKMVKPFRVEGASAQSQKVIIQELDTMSERLDDSLSIDRETFNLVLSFCFVGDIGYDPDDYQFKSQIHPQL